MTNEELGPATPGTAARCEVCGRSFCPGASSDPGCYQLGCERLKAENASLREGEARDAALNKSLGSALTAAKQCNASILVTLRRARELLNPDNMNESFTEEACDVLDAALSGGEAAGPAEPATEVVPESLPTRASLLESLREDHRVADQALAFAHHERDALRSENAKMREAAGNGCGVCHCRALAAAEQRAEAAEKERDKARTQIDKDTETIARLKIGKDAMTETLQWVRRLPMAKKYRERIGAALQGAAKGRAPPAPLEAVEAEGQEAIAGRAALHDEERPPPKRHKCMRCGGEFACRTAGCTAGYDVLPRIVQRAPDGSLEVVEHECHKADEERSAPSQEQDNEK